MIQVVVKRTINHKNVGSIASKVAVQMSAKLGGLPWMIKLPVNGLMTVGFDVSIHPRDKSRSIGALVATMNLKKTGAFYSITSSYREGNEMNVLLAQHMGKALEIYNETNDGCLPEKISFYRDGVGEGQINYVMKQEVEPLMGKLKQIYGDSGVPKLAYIIVNKRVNTRQYNNRLLSLFVAKNQISDLDFLTTEALSDLQYFVADYCIIDELPPGTFSQLRNIRELYLDLNNIQRLESNAFALSEKLILLHLGGNRIREIERNFFDNFPSLRYLQLYGNECAGLIDYVIEDIALIIPKFEKCFENFETPPTTPVIETTAPVTETTSPEATTQVHETTAGAAAMSSSLTISCFIVTSWLLLK